MGHPWGRVLLPVLGLAGAAALTSCTPDQVGTAALTGDRPTTVRELQDQTRQVLEARGTAGGGARGRAPGPAAATGAGEEQRLVLTRLVIGDLTDIVAEREGVTVSDGTVDQFNQQVDEAYGPEQLAQELVRLGVPPSARREFLRTQTLRQALGAKLVPGDPRQVGNQQLDAADERLAAAAREVPVEINPRYGRWVPEQVAVEGAVSGGLSVPAGQPQPR